MKVNRRKELFNHIKDEDWNDWHWQVKNRITTLEELKKYITLSKEEDDARILQEYRMAITPYYLSLIDPEDPYDPIRKQAIPTIHELEIYTGNLEDPLNEDVDSPVEGLTHRYPDRVLFLITENCSMYCRHCTRRRFAGHHDRAPPQSQIDAGIDYIKNIVDTTTPRGWFIFVNVLRIALFIYAIIKYAIMTRKVEEDTKKRIFWFFTGITLVIVGLIVNLLGGLLEFIILEILALVAINIGILVITKGFLS